MSANFSFPRLSLAALILALLGYLPKACLADALHDLEKSPQFSEFETHSSKAKKKTRKRDAWMDTKSEFGSIFGSNSGPNHLIDWIAPGTPGFTKFEVESHKEPDKASCSAKFSNRDDGQVVFVKIYVPHPRHLNEANLNLIPVFSALRKPPVPDAQAEKIKIRGFETTLYQYKDKDAVNCSMTIELNQGSLLNISSESCENSKRVIEFARSLDIPRLNRKLAD